LYWPSLALTCIGSIGPIGPISKF